MNNLVITLTRKYYKSVFLLNLLMIILGVSVLTFKNMLMPAKIIFSFFSGFIFFIDIFIIASILPLLIAKIPILNNSTLMSKISLLISLIYNGLYVCLSFISGFLLNSPWYFVYGSYYFIFALALFFIHRNSTQIDEYKSWKHLKFNGIFIIASAFIFQILVYFIETKQDTMSLKYSTAIYLIALFTFINITSSLYNVATLSKEDHTSVITNKYTNLASSLFSIFFLQTMLLREFGSNKDQSYISFMTITLGLVVFLLLIIIGSYLIFKANYKLKSYKNNTK